MSIHVARGSILGLIKRRFGRKSVGRAAALFHEGCGAQEAMFAELKSHANPQAVLPLTRSIIQAGRDPSAVDCFRAQYRLAALKRQADLALADIDVLAFPTTPTIYRLAEVQRDPLDTNTTLGTFTNFVNLLDLCAIAIPAGETPDRLPFGITLMAPAGYDYALLDAAASMRH